MFNGKRLTLKRFHIETDGIRLQSANPTMEPANGPLWTRMEDEGLRVASVTGHVSPPQAQCLPACLSASDGDGEWIYLTVPAEGLHALSEGLWETKSYGPDDVELSMGTRPAYENIESDKDEWALEVQYRKVRVNLASLLPADPEHRVADVQFRIRGYDEDGQYVAGTYDRVKLRVDTVPAFGDIASITVPGGENPGECGMLVLPSDTTPLVARQRALDPAGFLRGWSLRAVRGSNTAVGPTDTTTANPPAGEFPGSDLNHDRYYGTSERPAGDADGYITLNRVPSVGWLEGRDFCGYSFELRVRDRTTDGKTTPVRRKVWDEVLGLSAPAD